MNGYKNSDHFMVFNWKLQAPYEFYVKSGSFMQDMLTK